MKQAVIVTVVILLLVTLFANSQTKMSRQEYIDTYKYVAIKEMHMSGVPASITMAQGCLESENGNSALARKGKNHFGIKCRGDWKGEKMYWDDDKLHECFRKYPTVLESFIDHSEFLQSNGRYSSLFKLSRTDYKGWAHGLKKAGYATDRKYANLLIKIIEDEELWRLDKVPLSDIPAGELVVHQPQSESQSNQPEIVENAKKKAKQVMKKFEDIKINPYEDRAVEKKNGVRSIVVKPGDTYESIARSLDMKDWEMYNYNDADKGTQPRTGEFLYIEPKRYSAPKGNDYHTVRNGETLRYISQKYGIKESSLRRKNRLKKDAKAQNGWVLYLRKKRPKGLAMNMAASGE